MNSIVIIGLGYVGLPLSLQLARSGCRMLGLDIDHPGNPDSTRNAVATATRPAKYHKT